MSSGEPLPRWLESAWSSRLASRPGAESSNSGSCQYCSNVASNRSITSGFSAALKLPIVPPLNVSLSLPSEMPSSSLSLLPTW